MQEYTSQDFIKMQEQAIARVRQMQSKAKNFEPQLKTEEFDDDDVKIYEKISKNASDKAYNKEQVEKSEAKFPTYDKKENSSEKLNETKKIPLPKATVRKKPSGPLGAFLSMDNDTALILPLILLLGKEGADDILLLALLYILT